MHDNLYLVLCVVHDVSNTYNHNDNDNVFARLLRDLDLHGKARGHRDRVYGTTERKFDILPSEFVEIKPDSGNTVDANNSNVASLSKITTARRMAFVDGGNMVLDWAPDYMIVLNHVYYGVFYGTQKVKSELRTPQKTTFLSCVVPRMTQECNAAGSENDDHGNGQNNTTLMGFETKLYARERYAFGDSGENNKDAAQNDAAVRCLPDEDDLLVIPAQYSNDDGNATKTATDSANMESSALDAAATMTAAAAITDTIHGTSWLGSAARSLAELRLASRIVEDDLCAGDILILDGSLQTSFGAEHRYADSLYENAINKGVIVCGLAKTSRLVTESGDPLMSRVLEIARDVPFETWYVPVAQGIYAEGRGFTLAVKLHPSSRHVFRLDILSEQYNEMSDAARGEILGCIASNSGDLSMLGYPYGLIDADRHAQVRSTEAAMYRRTLASRRAGNPRWQDTARHSDSVIFHDLLNRVSG